MSKSDGGPAFPIKWIDPASGTVRSEKVILGMTLRDYFASESMPFSRKETYEKLGFDNEGAHADTARRAYAMADAMLAERVK